MHIYEWYNMIMSVHRNTQALMHLMKGNVGTGIMALPSAFKYGGLWVSIQFITIP